MSLSESSRSPDSPSPILAHRKKVSNLNLKRRRLSPYLKSESIAELDQNNPNISQEFPYCDISSKPYLDKPTESVMALPRDENDSPIVESYKVSTRRRTSSLNSIVPCEMKKDELSSSAVNVKIDTLPDSKNLLDNFDENFEPVEDERGSPILNADVNEVRLKRHYSMKMKGKDVIMHGKESKVLPVCSFSPAVHNEAKDQVLEYQEKEAEMKSDLEEISVMQSRKFEGIESVSCVEFNTKIYRHPYIIELLLKYQLWKNLSESFKMFTKVFLFEILLMVKPLNQLI